MLSTPAAASADCAALIAVSSFSEQFFSNMLSQPNKIASKGLISSSFLLLSDLFHTFLHELNRLHLTIVAKDVNALFEILGITLCVVL